MTLKAVIFDWGGTLSEYAPVELVDLWRRTAERLAPDDTDALCEQLVQVERAAWARTVTTRRSFTLVELLRSATAELGLDVTGTALEQIADGHLEDWAEHIRHDPQARDTLERLRARGCRIGLLSNTHWPRAFHERFLDRDGLGPLIDASVYTSEIDWIKPHPAAFRTTLDALGVAEPADAVFVGDNPLDDIRGAQQAGMRAVLRRHPRQPDWMDATDAVTPDAVVDDLEGVVLLVERWKSARIRD